jgi:hypothetical protein
MRTNVLNKPIKLRNKICPTEIYYTFSQWPSREIEGVEFIAVNKFIPTQSNTQQIHYMRKDSLEKVK